MNLRTRFSRITKTLIPALVLVAMAVGLSGGAQPASALQQAVPPTGMVCTTSATGEFTLNTTQGYIVQPDGNTVFMWGYAVNGGAFQHPSPVLCVNEGDTVTVVLNNTLNEDVSIIFPGQENVLANGVPSQPVFNTAGELVSMTPVAAKNGGSMTYSFVASRPGTFIYESGTEPGKQVNMGLFGALVVRPSMNVSDPVTGELTEAYVYNDPDTRYKPSTEYLLLISEIDPDLHQAVEAGFAYNMNAYKPRYWMYNGRGFPDTIADNGATWLSTQPYGTLVYFHPFDDRQQVTVDGVLVDNPAYNPYPLLMRIINVGTMEYTHHPHGNHGRLVGQDGFVLDDAGTDLSFEKFAVTIAPGQTIDALYQWVDVDKWHPIDNPIPVVIPQLQDLVPGPWYSGSPYLGNLDALPVGTQAFNQCGEYYHLAHNHALHQITAWGVVLSGQITFARIDPPLPNQCP